MMQFDWRQLNIKVLKHAPDSGTRSGYKLWQVLDERPKLADLNQEPQNFRVFLDPTGDTTLVTIWMNDIPLVSDQIIEHRDCAKLNAKFGIYRPGGQNPGVSELLLDNVQIHSHSPSSH